MESRLVIALLVCCICLVKGTNWVVPYTNIPPRLVNQRPVVSFSYQVPVSPVVTTLPARPLVQSFPSVLYQDSGFAGLRRRTQTVSYLQTVPSYAYDSPVYSPSVRYAANSLNADVNRVDPSNDYVVAGSNVYPRNYEGLLDSRREYAEASREHWENQAVASSSFLGSRVGQPAVVGVVPAQVASVPSALHVQKQIRMV